jgi:hypothetical protein
MKKLENVMNDELWKEVIDAHGLKIQGRGLGGTGCFCQNSRGGQGFQEKLPGGVHLFCVLLHFY